MGTLNIYIYIYTYIYIYIHEQNTQARVRKYGPGHALAGQDHKGGKKPIKSRVGFNGKVNELEGSQWENEKKIGQHYAAARVDERIHSCANYRAMLLYREVWDEDLNEGLLHLQQELRRIEQEVSRRQQRRQQQAQQDAATVTSDSDNAKTDLETEIDTVCR